MDRCLSDDGLLSLPAALNTAEEQEMDLLSPPFLTKDFKGQNLNKTYSADVRDTGYVVAFLYIPPAVCSQKHPE